MYKLYINLMTYILIMHMLKYTHTHRHFIEGGGCGSLLDQPHPSSSPYNSPSGYSEFRSSQGESYPFRAWSRSDQFRRLWLTDSGSWGSQGSRERWNSPHHYDQRFAGYEWQSYGSGGGGQSSWRSIDEWSGQDYQRSPWRSQSGIHV